MGPGFSCTKNRESFDGCKYRDKFLFYTKDVGKKCYFRWMEMAWSVGWNVLSGRFREL